MSKKRRLIQSHSFKMVWLYRREYMRLSFTIIISFTLILMYLLLSDSMIYHQIKDVYFLPDEVAVWEPSVSRPDLEQSSYQAIANHIADLDHSSYSTYNRLTATMQDQVFMGDQNSAATIAIQAYLIGNSSFFDYYHHTQVQFFQPELIRGRLQLMGTDEVIVDESMYKLLRGELQEKELENIFLTVKLTTLPNAEGGIEAYYLELRVVGVVTATQLSKTTYTEMMANGDDNPISFFPDIYMNRSVLSDKDLGGHPSLAIYSAVPRTLNDYATELSLGMQSALSQKEEARKLIEDSINQKMVLAIFLYLVLVLNISGNFQNLVEVRKSEIGIKRALGLTRYQVIRQFVSETLYVVGLCVAISLWVTACMGLVIKLYYRFYEYRRFTIYMNRFSIVLFLTIIIFITLTNCFMAAYKAGQAEIIRFIKADS